MTTLGQLTMLLLLAPAVLLAQHEGHDMSAMSGGPMVRFGAGVSMNRFASGTSWIPDDVTLDLLQSSQLPVLAVTDDT